MVGYEGMHAQKQTQLSTRLKGKQDDCNIKEVGGKRVRMHSGETCVVSDAGEQTHTVAAAVLADGRRRSSQVAKGALKSRPRDDT